MSVFTNTEVTMISQIRASKPGNLLSVIPCKSFGIRPQVEFKGKKQIVWAMEAIKTETRAVALFDYTGMIVAKSASYS
jgi:hypothetical protein